jgi:hypothetical protein
LIFTDPLGLKCVPRYDDRGNYKGKVCDGNSPGDPYPNWSLNGDNSVYAPNANDGLGPSGLVCGPSGNPDVASWIPDGVMTNACSAHDTCYSACGKTKEFCDLDFFLTTGNFLYYQVVAQFGQPAYDDAQAASGCSCENP